MLGFHTTLIRSNRFILKQGLEPDLLAVLFFSRPQPPKTPMPYIKHSEILATAYATQRKVFQTQVPLVYFFKIMEKNTA